MVGFSNPVARARASAAQSRSSKVPSHRPAPVTMTSVATVLGAMPLALATGAEAEARRPRCSGDRAG
ncbi:MAG: efflux RND transporter permease subunit [Paracoccaceae bacterium]